MRWKRPAGALVKMFHVKHVLLPADSVCSAGSKSDFCDLLQNLYQSFMKYVIISKIFVFIDDTFLQEVYFK